jgi:cytochrome c2
MIFGKDTGIGSSRLRIAILLALWIATTGAAAVAGAFAYRHRNELRALVSDLRVNAIVETNLYNVILTKVTVPALGRDGGLAAVSQGIVFANRVGEMWLVSPDTDPEPLAARVPINFDEFDSDPFNVNTNRKDQFAVKDLLIQELPEGLRVTASHNYWNAEDDCYGLRVSTLETTAATLFGGSHDASLEEWRTVFDTQPCAPLTQNPDGVHRNPTNGIGGRLVALSEDELLLTVGGLGPATPKNDGTTPFGKTVKLDLRDDSAEFYSFGHRNAQGLAISSEGDVWLTEHGDRGGDELNLIEQGRHYGYPYVSYGTEYESMVWATNPRQGRHEGYDKPMHAWVPSIGISQVTVLERGLFEHWQGDVIVSSLNTRSLYRVRIEQGRTIFVEPIRIGHRIRDVVEAHDGSLVLKTDDNNVIFIRPVTSESMDLSSLDPETRGRLVASGCRGCHSIERGGPDAIGPNLWDIVGRPIASRSGFTYSESLQAVDGRWNEARLADFIRDPNSVAPGTSMELGTNYTTEEVADLIAFLESLR